MIKERGPGSVESYAKKKKQSYEVIAKLIAEEGLTLNQLANSDFIRNSFKLQGLHLPSSESTIRKILLDEASNRVKSMKSEIAQLHSEGVRFSAIFDEWTSLNNDRYVGIILTSDKKLFQIGMIPIQGRANAENILELVEAKLNTVGLATSDLVAMITDGASVMKVLHSKTECEGITCILHGIHLAVKSAIVKSNDVQDCERRPKLEDEEEILTENGENDGFIENFNPDLKSVITKIKKIIGVFHHSALMSNRLADYCQAAGKGCSKLLTITEIRWNSLYLSIKRFLMLKSEISKSIIDENEDRSAVIFLKKTV